MASNYDNLYPFFVEYNDGTGISSERWSAKTLATELLRGDVKILRVDHIDLLNVED